MAKSFVAITQNTALSGHKSDHIRGGKGMACWGFGLGLVSLTTEASLSLDNTPNLLGQSSLLKWWKNRVPGLLCLPRYGSCGWLFSIDSTSIKHPYTSSVSSEISISKQYCFVEADIRHQCSCWQTSDCQKRRDYLSWRLPMLMIRLITK